MNLSRKWLLMILLLPVALGIARLRFDVEILNLLPEKLATAQGLKIYQQNFSDARELIITLEAPTGEEAQSAARALAQRLRARPDLVAGVTWQPGWMETPAEAMELVASIWLNQPPVIFGELTNRLAPTNLVNVLNDAREQMAMSLSPEALGVRGYDPYNLLKLPESVTGSMPATGTGEELFASADGTFRLMFVEATPDIVSYRACRTWLAAIQAVIAEARASGELSAQARLQFTGRPAFVTEIAGGMEHDMAGSTGGTLLVIGILFWLTHRRLRPLLWLLLLLLVILGLTMALGGLLLGTLSVVSMGFAAILAGLAEDFGIVIYQESRSHPELNARELRREVAPGIFWSAVTTAGAFLLLNLSVLPGLGQLGTLVAIGIVVAAAVMLYVYIPPLLRMRRPRDLAKDAHATGEKYLLFMPQRLLPTPVLWAVTTILLLGSLVLLGKQGPRLDHSPDVLKPRHSEASAALDQIKKRLGHQQEPMWVLVPGREETQVARRLVEVNDTLVQARSNQLIAGFSLPLALWPQPENQQSNRAAISRILQGRELLRTEAFKAGFMTNALVASEAILDSWAGAVAGPNVFWPSNRSSHWVLGKIVAHGPTNFLALGLIHPTTNAAVTRKFAATWPARLQDQGMILSGWELLGTTVFELVLHELPRVLVPILVLVILSLWLAFRQWKEVVLSLATLSFGGLCLAAAMNLLHWDWNILNLMALPLLLGMGVDFSIHIQLALRRYHGDLLAVRRSVGRALLLAGATTIAGFASLAFSTNSGMASLGKVCALGITLTLVSAIYLLPVWWKAWKRPVPVPHPPG